MLKVILFMLLLLFIRFTLKNKGSTMACYDLGIFGIFVSSSEKKITFIIE